MHEAFQHKLYGQPIYGRLIAAEGVLYLDDLLLVSLPMSQGERSQKLSWREDGQD